MNKVCAHDIVVLCFQQGWFCLDCKQLVTHDCGYNDAYRYGITGFRVGSAEAHKVALKYASSSTIAAQALGSIKSLRKAKSSAANGKLGGRPKKVTSS